MEAFHRQAPRRHRHCSVAGVSASPPSSIVLEGVPVVELEARRRLPESVRSGPVEQDVVVVSPHQREPRAELDVDLRRRPPRRPEEDGAGHVQRQELARRIANEEAAAAFSLSLGPLANIKLLRLSQDDHILLVIMHHIISDGWSMGVLIAEIAALYEAFLNNRESPLKELDIQYVDYAAWQRELLQGEVLEEHLSYWKSHLEGVEPLELPADRPRPSIQTYRGSSRSFMLPMNLSAELDAPDPRAR